MTTRVAPRRIWLALGLLCAFCYTTSHTALSVPNECSRLYLTVALFEQHSYQIDAVRGQFGPVLDEAMYGGHFYSDKAPGASLLALGPYALLRLFLRANDVTMAMLLGLGRYVVMVPFGIGAFFAFEALGAKVGIRAAAVRWVALAWVLATPAFHYSAAFFGHQIVATCFVSGLWLLLRQGQTVGRAALVNASSLGMLMGVAGVTEYQASLGIAAVTAYLVSMHWRKAQVLCAYIVGGLPFACWLAQYHSSCFGGPFEISYHHLANPLLAQVHRQGIGGVWMPNRAALFGALFSLHRGLLATSPFFFLVPLGFWGFWRRGRRALAILLGCVCLLEIGFVAGSATWDAGWGYGPRLLIPLLPMLCLLVAEALDQTWGASRLWGLAFSAWIVGLASFQSVTALFPEPPNELLNPWLDVVVPLGSASVLSPNLMTHWFGLRGWTSALPLLLLLGWFNWQVIRITRCAVDSWVWLRWAPVFPVIWLIAILTRGHTGSPQQRAEFVGFVRSLDGISLASPK